MMQKSPAGSARDLRRVRRNGRGCQQKRLNHRSGQPRGLHQRQDGNRAGGITASPLGQILARRTRAETDKGESQGYT